MKQIPSRAARTTTMTTFETKRPTMRDSVHRTGEGACPPPPASWESWELFNAFGAIWTVLELS
eukprot:4369108-Pyramimonas_sp.AAC.1